MAPRAVTVSVPLHWLGSLRTTLWQLTYPEPGPGTSYRHLREPVCGHTWLNWHTRLMFDQSQPWDSSISSSRWVNP